MTALGKWYSLLGSNAQWQATDTNSIEPTTPWSWCAQDEPQNASLFCPNSTWASKTQNEASTPHPAPTQRTSHLPPPGMAMPDWGPGALSVEALSPDLFLLPSITTQAVLGLLPHTEVGFWFSIQHHPCCCSVVHYAFNALMSPCGVVCNSDLLHDYLHLTAFWDCPLKNLLKFSFSFYFMGLAG